mgnify:CR=1 FL=1
MKRFIGLFFILITLNFISSAQTETIKFQINDTSYVFQTRSHFLKSQLKKNLKDGIYLGYYDSALTKLALKASIIDKKYFGAYQEWDKTGDLMTEVSYFKGKINGICMEKRVFEGGKYANITFWIDGAMDEIYLMEW